MDITLKGNNGEKVVIPIEDLIQKYWSDENSKPNRIEMSAKVKDETILAAMTICDEKEENYLSVDLESRNEKFDTEALWCSLEAPNTLNPFVTGYLYSGNNETESDDWLLRIVDGYRAADDDSPRIVFANKRTVSVQISVNSPRVKTSISCLPPLRNSLTNRSATPISERVWRKPRTTM